MAASRRPRPRRARPARVAEHALVPQEPLPALLLDTHAFLWFVTGSERLSTRARAAIENPRATVYLSAASAWEIAIKRQLGKLPEATSFAPTVSGYLRRRGFAELPISVDHAEAAGELPRHHDDPFDRMLAAQAKAEGLAFVSNERLFETYGVQRVW
jgi:PIN domain nuclease of toxin-antitoxin system